MSDDESEKPRALQPIRYPLVLEFGSHSLVYDSHSKAKNFYAEWYDNDARQTGRRSLKTAVPDVAIDVMRRIQRSGIKGDPIALLNEGAFVHIKNVVEDYRISHTGLVSAGQMETAIDHLNRHIGHIRVDEWTKQDFRKFKEAFLAEGYKLSYLSRTNAVLRAAFNFAEDEEKIARAPAIPEVCSEDDKAAAPLLGRLMTTKEIAELIDQVCEPHFLEYQIGLINSASRPVTILECDTNEIDWSHSIFSLNAPNRTQTKKYRPTIRVSETWEPWLRQAPLGRLISYNGEPVKSVKKAFWTARKAAGLEPDSNGVGVNSYSIRHTIGRYLEACGVPPMEISIFLGHQKIDRKKISDRYSPLNPRGPFFLREATKAIEQFVREIAGYTKKWDLLIPHSLKAGYEPVPGSKILPTSPGTGGQAGRQAAEHGRDSAQILPFRTPDKRP